MELKEYNTKLNFAINAYIDKSGNPWFQSKELATLLGYKNTMDEDDKI